MYCEYANKQIACTRVKLILRHIYAHEKKNKKKQMNTYFYTHLQMVDGMPVKLCVWCCDYVSSFAIKLVNSSKTFKGYKS